MTGAGTSTGGTTTVGVAFAIILLGLRTFGLGVGCLAATVGRGAGSGATTGAAGASRMAGATIGCSLGLDAQAEKTKAERIKTAGKARLYIFDMGLSYN